MAIWNRHDARVHLDHNIKMFLCGPYYQPTDITIECLDCGEVLVSFEDLENLDGEVN